MVPTEHCLFLRWFETPSALFTITKRTHVKHSFALIKFAQIKKVKYVHIHTCGIFIVYFEMKYMYVSKKRGPINTKRIKD